MLAFLTFRLINTASIVQTRKIWAFYFGKKVQHEKGRLRYIRNHAGTLNNFILLTVEVETMRMIHTKFGYESPTEAKCDGELNKYFNQHSKREKQHYLNDKRRRQRHETKRIIKAN